MEGEAFSLRAPAKVNMFLRILAREESGFHQLETLFCALDFADTLRFARTDAGVRLEVEGPPLGPVRENLVFRAAQRFLEEGRVEGGVRIHLEKRIPAGAGLGGGSSDAATTLEGLQALYPGAMEAPQLLCLAGALGSDVPFFLSPSPLALAWGRGSRLLPLEPLAPAPVVLALPRLRVPTSRAYGLLAEARRGKGDGSRPISYPPGTFESWETVADQAHNDFEGPIFEVFPELREIRDAMAATDPLICLLSGSGSALFALYLREETASRARARLSSSGFDAEFVLTRTESRGSNRVGKEQGG